MADRRELASHVVMISCYRAYTWGLGKLPNANFGALNPDHQEMWAKFARQAPEVLARMEGKTFPEVASAVRKAVLGAEKDAGRPEMLAWEAAVRHLGALIASDEPPLVPELPALEQRWKEWTDQRNIKLGVR
jgi:hypothetical protein